MLRIVIDTDVLVSGFVSPDGASRQLLLGALDGKFAMLVSTPLLLEYEAVLLRPQHLARARLSLAEAAEFLDGLATLAYPVILDFNWRPTGADEDDELVVQTAINGYADFLATFNLRHMRDVGTRFGFVASRPGPLIARIAS